MPKIFISHLLFLAVLEGVSGRSIIKNETRYENFFFPMETDGNTSKQYYYGTAFKGNYYQAIQFCNYHKMDLLSIESTEENDFLFDSLTNFAGFGAYGFWTSGTLIPENHWVWLSTGKPIVHKNWIAHPTNQLKGCLGINYTKSRKSLSWGDENCKSERHFICETRERNEIGPVNSVFDSVRPNSSDSTVKPV